MKIAFFFPGQGSQAIGMCKDLYNEFFSVREVFKAAEDISELSITDLCFNGPIAHLTQTRNLQPALTAVNIACAEALKAVCPVVPDVCAGHSLGEYSALYQSGVVSLEDTFRLVMKRGQLMQREADRHPGSMAAVVKLPADAVIKIVDELSAEGSLTIANYNAPLQTVISGSPDLVQKASERVRDVGGLCFFLNVSGAWHSDLIREAHGEFKAFLQSVRFSPPRVPVVFNVTGTVNMAPDRIKDIMAKQFCSPVRWYDTVQQIVGTGVDTFIELGPGNVLTGLLKRSLPKEYPFKTFNIHDLKSLEVVAAHMNPPTLQTGT